MWYIQTPVDALLLPTDGAGRCTLTGNAPAWHHLVRDSAFDEELRADIATAPVRWSIWAWQQLGRRAQLPEQLAGNESLAFMVRAGPTRACVFAHYPMPGKRKSDGTIEVIVVVPPDHFARYEALMHFAMTLPSGYLGLTVPAPAVVRNQEDGTSVRTLIEQGSSAIMDGMEMVVARAKPQKYSRSDIRTERRIVPEHATHARSAHDDDDEWLLFAAAPQEEQAEDLESSGE
jgi:hypothetical protein